MVRILLVEDDPDVGPRVRAGLKQHGYEVDLETDGDLGYQRAKENDYDLVILDNVLPGRHGIEICRALRDIGRAVPILILSIDGASQKKVDLLKTGADDYVTKPFSLEELAARVEALLRRGRELREPVLQVGDLVLDKENFCALRGERRIYLTPKEYELLQYLMRNKERVLTRGMIMEHVWDMNADLFSHTIETHVMRLRRKVDPHPEERLIHTVPGRGYRLGLVR